MTLRPAARSLSRCDGLGISVIIRTYVLIRQATDHTPGSRPIPRRLRCTTRGGGISSLRDRLPTPQPLGDQLRALLIVAPVEDAHVRRIGAQVNARGPRVHFRVRVRTGREVPG